MPVFAFFAFFFFFAEDDDEEDDEESESEDESELEESDSSFFRFFPAFCSRSTGFSASASRSTFSWESPLSRISAAAAPFGDSAAGGAEAAGPSSSGALAISVQ